MQAITICKTPSLVPLLNTLIGLCLLVPFRLLPHCCSSAFWITVTRLLLTLRPPPISFEVCPCFVSCHAHGHFHSASSVRTPSPKLTMTEYSHHTISPPVTCLDRRFVGPTTPTLVQNDGSLPTASTWGGGQTANVSCIQGRGAAGASRLSVGISCLD